MPKYFLKLYVRGSTQRSRAAIRGLHALLARLDGNDHRHEIINVLQDPDEAEDEDMLASPTLVRVWPPPRNRVVGDLSDTRAVADALGLVLKTEGHRHVAGRRSIGSG